MGEQSDYLAEQIIAEMIDASADGSNEYQIVHNEPVSIPCELPDKTECPDCWGYGFSRGDQGWCILSESTAGIMRYIASHIDISDDVRRCSTCGCDYSGAQNLHSK